ncbi:MAG: lytic transglycosylase domain-containing protein [Proteobacteria bacterium]|nr:lytic transglycosylase domain-containing protein [Pseudomonadota bacterium]MCH8976176.1 lytic transglycosylase domain-containing protein [Pseudomonadota bacterium]MCH9048186.1 lytic transglycosylase domain-containing protein [Pseudomonadota bacterium]TDJ19556.1 MAG: lytic transglycosylase domain-containing protein [Gammaproteobacteria bacterium]
MDTSHIRYTIYSYGVKNRRNPNENVNGGTKYLRDLLVMFDNNLRLALAAYNAGEGAVKKYNNKIPPYKETQNYVKKVIDYYNKYKQSMG